tara:strand:- start:273 stop:629 length:357 start_codon:yes stop_codon:yes gene_type:complete
MAFNYSRYRLRRIGSNYSPKYARQFAGRGINGISRQFLTPKFTWPTQAQLQALNIEREVWETGSRFYKLAAKYYGDSSLWWIIAWFNQKPLETDFAAGDVVMIPLPLDRVLTFFEAPA